MAHAHAHRHNHDHSHGVGHGPGPVVRAKIRQSLIRALILTVIVAIAEVVGGLMANSMALLADAGHMVTDVAALALALLAAWLSNRPHPPDQTFGPRRWEVLGAWVNGAALIAIAGGIMWESVRRFSNPPEVQGNLVLILGFVGLVTNSVSAWMLHETSHGSLNVRGAYLHVLGDIAGSLATIIAAALILTLNWRLADPIASVAVALLVLFSAGRLMRDATYVLLEATPAHIDLPAVRAAVTGLDGVTSVHDLHVWTVGSGVVAMSAHLVVTDHAQGQSVVESSRSAMAALGISHVTIQVEGPALDGCGDCAPTVRSSGTISEEPVSRNVVPSGD